MTKSTSMQAIRLFNAMLDRANSGRPGLTLTTWERNLDFLDREQILDAMNRLQHSGHIRVDIGGERPAIVILKGNYKDTYPLERLLVLGMAPLRTLKVESTPGKDLPASLTDLIPAKPDYVDVVQEIAAEVMQPVAPPAPQPIAVTFVLDADDIEYLCERLDQHKEPISLDHYAKELFEEYVRLLRAEDGPKHRLSADVLRAAKSDGRPLPEFVTALIGIGLTAYQMNGEVV
jgi:hypothetical protein